MQQVHKRVSQCLLGVKPFFGVNREALVQELSKNL